MTESAGLQGPLQSVFEDGLRLLAAALALKGERPSSPEAVSTACSAIRCFLKIIEAAGAKHFPDPEGEIPRLKAQCDALLTPCQDPGDALLHALEAARLARDAAARILVLLPPAHPGARDA